MLRALCFLPVILILVIGCSSGDRAQNRTLRLATTTSTRDSGLLDEIVPLFEQQHDARVEVIAAGTGKALRLGEAGDVDVLLVHARAAEDAFVAAGHGVRREDVMFNRFVLLGPTPDPAGVADLDPPEALRAIGSGGFRFASRGDDSGTHKREMLLWQEGGGQIEWPEYLQTGLGMGSTLIIAHEMQAYTLCDHGTFLRFREKIELVELGKQTESMHNPYGVIVINPRKSPAINSALADDFVDFLISPHVQQLIANYRPNTDEPLFRPLHLTPAE